MNDGGPAFPAVGEVYGNWTPGMTLRDYFAAQALAGKMAAETDESYTSPLTHASLCYRIADAMLEEREK